MGTENIVTETNLEGLPEPRRGKVRDIYDLGDRLLIVATDRISAFDAVLPNGIPGKGEVLTKMAAFWFRLLADRAPNHLLSVDAADLPPGLAAKHPELEGRFMLVKKVKPLPVECVARGYISGSAWKEYKGKGTVNGVSMPAGLVESGRFPEPIFTPTTKAETGHDEAIGTEEMAGIVGADVARALERKTLDLYGAAFEYAEARGILIADTKLEFGLLGGELVLIDEIFTPDSSRFWPKDTYSPGGPQPSFDKQFVRDWLESSKWDKTPPAPVLPGDVVARTAEKYREAMRRLTG